MNPALFDVRKALLLEEIFEGFARVVRACSGSSAAADAFVA